MPPQELPVLEEEILFNADSLLKAIAGVHVCDIGPRRSRQVAQEYFLQRVEETITAMNRSYIAARDQLIQELDRDPSQEKEATQQSYARWFNARRLSTEASMSNQYFHCMLEDLQRSERNMDLMTVDVPPHAAPVPSHVSSEQLRKKATIQRTYHSSESLPFCARYPMRPHLQVPTSYHYTTLLIGYRSCTRLTTRPGI
ncbi:hypothetical protein FIBSPDRAFT_867015, partial [Athelia psychrophila]